MTGPEEKREFRLGWSLFRRAHQAVAKRCHEAAHRAKHAAYHDAPRGGRELDDPARTSEASAPTIAVHANKEAGLLTDAQWERVRALLPTQEPGQGRPRRDDRQVLCGILWVMDTPALRGETCQKRSLGPTARSTVGTANGAMKGSGLE